MENLRRISILLLGATVFSVATAVGLAAQSAEPKWPQTFQIFPGEPTSFGFEVTQPGLITVSVTVEGQPVTASLTGAEQPVQQTGVGTFILTCNATAADVQKSSLWTVVLTTAGAPSMPPTRAPLAMARGNLIASPTPPSASGKVSVQHPTANAQVVQAQLQKNANASQLQAQQVLLRPAVDGLGAIKTAYAQQLATQQAAQKQALLTQISVSKPIAMATRQGPLVPTIVSTGTTSAADTGAGPAGSSGVQTVAAPSVTSLSVTQGQPGDPVLFSGSRFGTNPEVHFLVNPGMDMVARIEPQFSSDSQILAYVPDASGVSAYSGVAYVKAGNQKSNFSLFQFNPALDYAQLEPMSDGPDANIDNTDFKPLGRFIFHDGGGDLLGHRKNDFFYETLVLKNNWTVDSVNVQPITYNGADAYVADSRVGTNSPYVKVHWWTNACSSVLYKVVVTVKGPKGLPYR